MICTCSARRGLSLIEILVASALFGLFTGMVAGALIMAHRTQEASTAKLDAVRRASLALDLLVRDLEAARFSARISMNGAPVSTTATRPAGVEEFQIQRLRPGPGALIPDDTEEVIAGYWYDEGDPLDPDDGMVRRTLYQFGSIPLAPVADETADGRVLVRDVKEFLVSSSVASGLTFIKAEIWVSSIGNPITTSVALEPPAGGP